MILLSLGDLHGSIGWNSTLEKAAAEADAILVCGDLTQFGRPEDADRLLDDLLRRCDQVLAVAGNCDSHAIERHLASRSISLHGRGRMLGGVIGVCGVSGSNPTPFGTPLEYDEDTLAEALRSGWEQIADAHVRILLHHAPPKHTACDRTAGGLHVGVRGLRAFCEKEEPELVVCGHIHEARGQDMIGRTLVVNGGMAARGHGVRIEVREEEVTVELI